MQPHRLAPTLLAALAACGTTGSPAEFPELQAEVIFDAGTKLGGCAVGDVYPERPGLEVCAVSGAGELHVLSRVDGEWVAETPLSTPGELIQVACGELLADRPGVEVLAGGIARGTEDDGGPGKLWMASRTEDGASWESASIFDAGALVHAVLVADLALDAPGAEGVSAGFDRLVHRFDFSGGSPPEATTHGLLADAAKGMCTYRDGLAVAVADGGLSWFTGTGEDVRAQTLFRGSSGLARVAADGDRLAASSNDGRFWLLEWDGTHEPAARAIFTEPGGAKGRGAVFADLAGATGAIPVTAGYSGQVTALEPVGDGTFTPRVLLDDGASLHHLCAGDVLPEVPGDELVAVGFSGRVVLVSAR